MVRLVLLACLLATGCGTDAQGTDACRRIEQARCQRAVAVCPELGIVDDDSLKQCLGAARDACLHGLAVSEPAGPVVNSCVAAIAQAPTCSVVMAPESLPDCAFLLAQPPADAAAVDDASGTGP
jgi:hypothetical protein